MPKFPINLGRKMTEPMPMTSEPGHEKSYPMLYLDWDKSYELPDSGEITLKFRKTSESTSKDKSGERQSVTLEMREICDVKAKGGKPKDDEDEDGGKALDKLREETEDEESEY